MDPCKRRHELSKQGTLRQRCITLLDGWNLENFKIAFSERRSTVMNAADLTNIFKRLYML